jgi:hypothetical protein
MPEYLPQKTERTLTGEKITSSRTQLLSLSAKYLTHCVQETEGRGMG